MTGPLTTGRIPHLDIARTAALGGMAVYHFFYDLELFGFLPGGMLQAGYWRELALLIAGSFLFLSGVSLFLAHHDGIRWRAFGRRVVVLAAASAAISLVTYLAIPDRFIHFGILHSITVASLLGLPFVFLPSGVVIAAGAAVLAIPQVFRDDAFNAGWLLWTGLSTERRPSMDFEPVFPWFGVFLFGIAAAKLLVMFGGFRTLVEQRKSRAVELLSWPGRNSLAVYLLHQPIILGVLWIVSRAL